ncbi:MAG: radical SAM protein [Gallionella sp.]|nr:radical SAM protein [Gallionella sp.]
MGIVERIDAITAIPAAYLREDPPAPRSVKIELTGRCNYRCGFCALRTRENQPKGDMDLSLFRKITIDMRVAGVEEIGLFYLGESFSAPELLIEAVEWCKQELRFPYVFLTTNGSLATPDLVRRCMMFGLDSLKFSVNAADEAQFEAVMGVKGALFRKSLANLQAARSLRDGVGYRCGIYASSIQYDGEQAAKMQAMLEAEVLPYVDCHYFLPLYGSMTHWNETGDGGLGYVPTAGNQGRIGALRDPLPCWSAFTEGHVTADGILTACCFDSDGRFAMGDLTRQRFMDAWHSLPFKELRGAHLAKDVSGTICEGCLAYA